MNLLRGAAVLLALRINDRSTFINSLLVDIPHRHRRTVMLLCGEYVELFRRLGRMDMKELVWGVGFTNGAIRASRLSVVG